MILNIGLMFFYFINFITDLRKNICNRLQGTAAQALHKRITRFGIQFNGGNTGAVLATVMLLFHQQVQLVKAVQYCSVLLLVITERFAETNESNAAFVFNFVAHDVE